jgi:hypothetical protein
MCCALPPCRLLRHLGRDAPGADLPFKLAVGNWHIRPHRPECNVKYNARYMYGTGLSFGDNIEHLWRELRPHWSSTVYMSPAARQDMLTRLVGVAPRMAMWDWQGSRLACSGTILAAPACALAAGPI